MSEVDFRNLAVYNFDRKGRANGHSDLRDGRYKKEFRIGFTSIEVASVYYLTKPGANPEYALVEYIESDVGATSAQTGSSELFELSNHRLKVTQEFDWDEHHLTPPYTSFDDNKGIFLVRANHYLPGDARCCSSATDFISLKWNGTRFEREAVRTELSDDGKREGKTLQFTKKN